MPFIRERKEKDRLAYENLTALERYINTNTASAVELF